ncbi:MAG: hypothetical protein FJ125_17605, partial [Deltaproteobacteria bacterium]|nr:hypothetical protein [Deltaproteobacteria bacterium]
MAHLLRRTRTARPSLRRAALVRARRAAAPFLLAALLCPAPAQGGGFELPVLGPAGVGRGGAVTASVEDLTAAELNPAGLARLKGTHTMLAAGPLYNQLRYRRAPLYDWSRATSNSPPPVVQYGEIQN